MSYTLLTPSQRRISQTVKIVLRIKAKRMLWDSSCKRKVERVEPFNSKANPSELEAV